MSLCLVHILQNIAFWNSNTVEDIFMKTDRKRNHTLRKHAYSNILKILSPKMKKRSDKNSDIFHISGQNVDFGYSLEPPKKNNVYPYKL